MDLIQFSTLYHMAFGFSQLYSRCSIVTVLLQKAHLSDSTRFILSSSYFVATLWCTNLYCIYFMHMLIFDLRFIINACSISSFVNSSPVLFFHFVAISVIMFVLPLFLILYSLLTPFKHKLMIVFRKVLTGPTSFVYVFPIDLVSFKYLVMEVLIAPYSRKFVCIPYIFDQFIQT